MLWGRGELSNLESLIEIWAALTKSGRFAWDEKFTYPFALFLKILSMLGDKSLFGVTSLYVNLEKLL